MTPPTKPTRFQGKEDKKALRRELVSAVAGEGGFQRLVAMSNEFVKAHGYHNECVADDYEGSNAEVLDFAAFNLIQFADCKGLAIELIQSLQKDFGVGASVTYVCLLCKPVERTCVDLQKYFCSFQDLTLTLAKYNPPLELLNKVEKLNIEAALNLILRHSDLSSEPNEDLKRFVDDVVDFRA